MTKTRLVLLLISLLFLADIAATFSVRGVTTVASSRWNVHNLETTTALTAEGDSAEKDKDNDANGDNNGNLVDRFFERAVREVTGEDSYQIGDLGDPVIVNDVNNKTTYQYQFGDITRSIISGMTQSQNETETRTTTTEKKGSPLLPWTNTLFQQKDLPIDMLEVTFGSLDRNQRINLILAGIQLAAEGMVLWGLATNLFTLVTASLSWILSLQSISASVMPLPLIPIHIDKELWRTFVSKFTGLDFVLGPFFLIARAVMVLICFRRYHSFVVRLSASSWVTSGRWKRYNSVVFNKAIAVIMAFFMTNIVLSGIVSALTFSLIGLVFRLCL